MGIIIINNNHISTGSHLYVVVSHKNSMVGRCVQAGRWQA